MINTAEEKQFENKIKAFLKGKGCWILKTFSNGIQRSGVPDLLCSVNGNFVGIEVKAKNGRPSPLQIYNLEKIDESGGFAILLYPDDWLTFQSFIESLFDSNEIPTQILYKRLKTVWKEN